VRTDFGEFIRAELSKRGNLANREEVIKRLIWEKAFGGGI